MYDDLRGKFYMLRRAYNNAAREIDVALSKTSLSVEKFFMLCFLDKYPEANVKDIASEFGLSIGAICNLRKRLVLEGLLEKKGSYEIAFIVTDKGKSLLKEAVKLYLKQEKIIFKRKK